MNLNDSQKTAVLHDKGPMMVLAGPGSGKTAVITMRTKTLITRYQVRPENILVITFTKAAANEMKERFIRLMNGRKVPVSFGTFHAVYFTVLKYAYGYTGANIIREDVRFQFFRDTIHRLQIDTDDETDLIRSLTGEISLLKNSGTAPENFYSSCCSADSFREVYRMYQRFLASNRLIDFDDMLVYTLDLFRQRKDILSAWQRKFRYILIDEFQDINQIQYDIIRMMAEPENNLFIVGDDDQSIYRFRGARPEIMLNFEKDYPACRKVILEHNYRSGSEIIKASLNLISHNEKRFEKNIQAGRTETGELQIKKFKDQRAQNLFIIGEIRRLEHAGIPLYEIAVLSRTNIGLRYLMEQLSSYNIPYYAKDRIPSLYSHWIARDIFTYIDIACGDASRANFLRIMNRPNRYLSREGLPHGQIDFREWKRFYVHQDWMVQRLKKLQTDLDIISRMRPFSAVNYIRKAIAYEDYLRDHADARGIPQEDLFEILDELSERAKDYETYGEWKAQIHSLEEENAIKSNSNREKTEAVVLSTYHSSKGLEYHTVFLPDVCEKITPYRKAVLDEDLEEERRMFYVAMTRAKDSLYILQPHQIHNKDMEASRFLMEIKNRRRTDQAQN